MANTYMYEKMVATRHAEIRRDMQLSRKPTYAEQSPTLVPYSAGKPGTLLVEPGSRLQEAEQRREATVL